MAAPCVPPGYSGQRTIRARFRHYVYDAVLQLFACLLMRVCSVLWYCFSCGRANALSACAFAVDVLTFLFVCLFYCSADLWAFSPAYPLYLASVIPQEAYYTVLRSVNGIIAAARDASGQANVSSAHLGLHSFSLSHSMISVLLLLFEVSSVARAHAVATVKHLSLVV